MAFIEAVRRSRADAAAATDSNATIDETTGALLTSGSGGGGGAITSPVNDRGDVVVSAGLGIVREIAVADVDLTKDPLNPAVTLGMACAIEVPGGGKITITGPDNVDVTLGALLVLPAAWSADSLLLKGIKAAGSTATVVRVRW